MLYDKTFTKDPDDVLDYSRDWSNVIDSDETITSSSWILPNGIVEDSSSHDTTSTTIWLSGGASGQDYGVTNRIVTDKGKTIDRTFLIRVRER